MPMAFHGGVALGFVIGAAAAFALDLYVLIPLIVEVLR